MGLEYLIYLPTFIIDLWYYKDSIHGAFGRHKNHIQTCLFFCGKNRFGSLGQAPGTPAEPTPTPMPPVPGMEFCEIKMGYLQNSAKTTIKKNLKTNGCPTCQGPLQKERVVFLCHYFFRGDVSFRGK